MDKEFLDKVLACKTAEELRALLNSRKEMSDDELEQINGGAIYTANKINENQFNECVLTLTRKFGYNAAVDMLRTCTGYTKFANTGLGQDASDEEKISAVLANYWSMRKTR